MALSAKQQNRLYEIYQVPISVTNTVITGNSGIGDPALTVTSDYRANVKTQLQAAILLINADSAQSQAVAEILDEYDNFRLDPSNIDRQGYSFRSERSLRAIWKALYPYTGIVAQQQTNRLRLG